jgi:hypothetical protein
MSSLDDTHERLIRFQLDLARFTEQMASSLGALRDHHAALDGLWSQDTFRRRYDAAWEPLERTVESFRDHESPEYDRFLAEKLAALDDYLHGGR